MKNINIPNNICYILIIIMVIIFIYINFLYILNPLSSLAKIMFSSSISVYDKALKRAKDTNKPLMIISSQKNDYIGDINIKLSDCANCVKITKEAENIIYNFSTNSHVIFILSDLSKIDKDKIDIVSKHLYRISGGDIFTIGDNLTILNIK